MTQPSPSCGVCGTAGVLENHLLTLVSQFECARCGQYRAPVQFIAGFQSLSKDAEFLRFRPYLSAHLRQTSDRGEIVGDAADVSRLDRGAIARKVQARVTDWRAALTARAMARMRQTLREVLAGPLVLTPEGRTYRFEGEPLVGSLLLGEVGLLPLWRARQDSEPLAMSEASRRASREVPGAAMSRNARNGAPGRTRTCDPRLRRPVLYPTELRARDPSGDRCEYRTLVRNHRRRSHRRDEPGPGRALARALRAACPSSCARPPSAPAPPAGILRPDDPDRPRGR